MNNWAEELELDMDLYNDMVKSETEVELSPELAPAVTSLNWDEETFSWETLTNDLFGNAIPVSVENLDDEKPVISDIPSPSGQSDAGVTNHNAELMAKYSLSDDQLGDMTLKQLKKWCPDEQDYGQLKSYRRTCLNRGYARSSRSKQQQKATSLSAQLSVAEEQIKQLRKEVDEKNMRIQYLELENRLLLDFNKDN